MGIRRGPGQGDPQGLLLGVVGEGGGNARDGETLAFSPTRLGDMVQFLPGQDSLVERFPHLPGGQDETLDPGQADHRAQGVGVRGSGGLIADHHGQGAVGGAQAARVQRKKQGILPGDIEPGGAAGLPGGEGQPGLELPVALASQLQ